MEYNINLFVNIQSNLTEVELKKRLIIALYDESGYSKLDGVDDNLDVIEYIDIEVIKVDLECSDA